MIGPRIGCKSGPLLGAQVGVGADGELVGLGWTVDALAGKAVPANTTELSAFASASGLPGSFSALWGFQEASGSVVDLTGNGFTLAPTGSPSYLQALASWTRLALTMPDAGSINLHTTSASLPDLSTTSIGIFLYAQATGAPALGRNFVTAGTATQPTMLLQTSKIPQTKSSTNTANGTTVIDTAVVPLFLKYDKTNSLVVGYTLVDKMAPTFIASTGKQVTLGPSAPASNSGPIAFTWGALLIGSAAELSDAQVRTMFRTAGFAPTW